LLQLSCYIFDMLFSCACKLHSNHIIDMQPESCYTRWCQRQSYLSQLNKAISNISVVDLVCLKIHIGEVLS
jgi:hypothetical protein